MPKQMIPVFNVTLFGSGTGANMTGKTHSDN